MPAVTVQIPDELAARFDSLEALDRALFEAFIIEQRQCGHLSLGRAAELLGLRYAELLELLAARGLGPINATPEELAQGWGRFSALMQGR